MRGYKLFNSAYSNTIKQSFNHLTLDKYYNETRYRAFSLINSDTFSIQGNPQFNQSSTYNNYLGDTIRTYPNVNSEIFQDKSFQKTLTLFRNTIYSKKNPYTLFYIHQIRVECSNSNINPVPEGIHRDGYDYICISCVNKVNVNPVYNEILDNNHNIVKSIELNENQHLVVNDKEHLHNVTQLSSASSNNSIGHRDIFVFTTQK